MKNTEFIALLVANTNKTANLRTFMGKWYTGAGRVPNEVTTKIGHMVNLIQESINKGFICNKDKEGLLIYNFQPEAFCKNQLFCSLDILRKPLKDLNETDLKLGEPLQLFINTSTTEVCNATKGLLSVEMITMEEVIEQGLEEPIVYGKYLDFTAVCGFVAISSDERIQSEMLFAGDLDHTQVIQQSVAFDSFVEAEESLKTQSKPYNCIAELIYPKEEMSTLLQTGLSKSILKLIKTDENIVLVTPHPKIAKEEARIDNEITLLNEALTESSVPQINPSEFEE